MCRLEETSITCLAASCPSVPPPNNVYLVWSVPENVALTPRFTGFHIKALPGQLQKHLWNVCCFFSPFFFLNNEQRFWDFGRHFMKAPPPPSVYFLVGNQIYRRITVAQDQENGALWENCDL